MRTRKGVVLLITVGFITAVMALIAYQFAIIDRGLKRSTDETFYYQSALLLADINEKLLPSLLKGLDFSDNNDSNGSISNSNKESIGLVISGYYNIPFPLINDEGIGTAVVTLKPSGTRFNINDFTAFDADHRGFFEYFTRDLDDHQLLMDLIDLALENNASNGSYNYLLQDADLPLNSVFFRKKEIVDRDQFTLILDAYFGKTKDKKVYTLPWDDFLDFRSAKPMNISFLSYEYCKSLFYDKPQEWHEHVCKNEEELIFSPEELPDLANSDDNKTMHDHGITFDLYNPNILIDVAYSSQEKHSDFVLLFDIEKSKTLWIEAKL